MSPEMMLLKLQGLKNENRPGVCQAKYFEIFQWMITEIKVKV